MDAKSFSDLIPQKKDDSGQKVALNKKTEIKTAEDSEQPKNLESALNNLFEAGASGTGEEELLRIASDYALQLSARQIRALLRLRWRATQSAQIGRKNEAKMITEFVDGWLVLKKNNFSDRFVMRALDAISLRHYIGENAFKVDIRK